MRGSGYYRHPLATWRTEPFSGVAEIVVFGVRYRMPVVVEPRSSP